MTAEMQRAGQVPPVLVLGESLLLSGQALLDAHALVVMALRQTEVRDGIKPQPRLLQLRSALADASATARQMSGSDASDVRELRKEKAVSQVMEAREVAERLGVTTRHVTRTAQSLGGRQVAGRGSAWIFEEAAVDAYLAALADRTQE